MSEEVAEPESWWELVLKCSDLEIAKQLIEDLGISGFEVMGDRLRCVVGLDTEEEVIELTKKIGEYGAPVESYVMLREEDFENQGPDLTPIEVGEVTIVPILDADQEVELPEEPTIFIVPGTGFGTGQHESTRFALQLIQHEAVREAGPSEVLDLGTGSGVLAIGFCRVHEGTVRAVDIEDQAIDNANKNLKLNELTDRITTGVGDSFSIEGEFDLATANIDAPTLTELEPELNRLVKDGGQLILSGIKSGLAFEVEAAYLESDSSSWQCVAKIDENEWTALLLQKCLKN